MDTSFLKTKYIFALIFINCVLYWSVSTSPLNDAALRIIGGEPDLSRLFPFQVSLRVHKKEYPNNSIHLCSGSILNERWILTAAHCVEVLTSEHNMYADIEGGEDAEEQQILVDEFFMHPKYNTNLIVNDIALLHLEEEIEYSEHIDSIQLPQLFHEPSDYVIASGWGITEDGELSSVLMYTNRIQILSNENCNKEGAWGQIEDSQICVVPIVPGDKVDVCMGDSGGPLIQHTTENGTVLVGIVSFGSSCLWEPAQDPGVYTKVSYFIDWIQDTISEYEEPIEQIRV